MDFVFIFACFLFTSCLAAEESLIRGLQGKAVMLTTNINIFPEHILWKHNGNKVVEFNGNEQTTYASYDNRVILGWDNGDLEIERLTLNDGGNYELEVFEKQNLVRKTYRLDVFENVAKPSVRCEVKKDGESGQWATLRCSAESKQPEHLSFKWSLNGIVSSGQNVTIRLGDGHDKDEHTCTVSNPLSSQSTVFISQECNPVQDNTLVTTLCILFSILLILVVALLYILWRKGCCHRKRGDVEKQPCSDDGVTQSQEAKPFLNRDNNATIPSFQRLRNGYPENKENGDDHSVVDEQNTEDQDVKPQKGHVKSCIKVFEPSSGFSPPAHGFATSSPVQDLSVNVGELDDKYELKQAAEKEDSEDASSESKKADDALTETVPALDCSVNAQEPSDENEVTQNKDSEGDSSESEKADDAVSGKDQDGENSSSSPVLPQAPPVLVHSVNEKEPSDEEEPKEAAEEEDSEGDSAEADDALSGTDKDSESSSRPAVAPKLHLALDLSVKNQKPADEDGQKVSTEKEEAASADSKADDAVSGEDKDSETSSLPPVATKPHLAQDLSVKNQPADETRQKESTEKEEAASADSKAVSGAVSGEDKDSETSSCPPVEDISVKNQKPADEDEHKEVTEKEESEAASADSDKHNVSSESDEKKDEDAALPHSVNVAPKNDADKHKEDTSLDLLK